MHNSLFLRSLATAVLALLCTTICFPQTDGATPTAPRLIIRIPDNIPSNTVWIRYLVGRRGSHGERMQLDGNSREYVILRVRNSEGKPENVKVVLYSPGCQFKTYDLNLVGDSDVEERFQCDPLAVTTLHAVIPVNEIPRAIYFAMDKRVDVVGELEAEWICSFFLKPADPLQPTVGSCLGSGVPLGILGTIDPAAGGNFEITVPNFRLDPAFNHANQRENDFDVIEMLMRDHKLGAVLGGIKPKETAAALPGLKIQADYPNPVVFTRAH